MNLRALLGKKEIITAAERRRLEELERACAELDAARKEVELWPGSPAEREQRIRALAAAYAAKPSPEAQEQIVETGKLPASGDIKTWALEALERERRKRMAPSHAIVREVFKRAEEEGVVERARLIAAEKKEHEEVGVPYVAGPKVRALEERIMGFRAEIKVKLPEEDETAPEPAPWRERLAAFL